VRVEKKKRGGLENIRRGAGESVDQGVKKRRQRRPAVYGIGRPSKKGLDAIRKEVAAKEKTERRGRGWAGSVASMK